MGNNTRTEIGYRSFQARVKLVGTLALLSGLHIGQGRALEPAASELPVLKDWAGRPFIPGSSLKGVLRSNLEAWLRGLFPTAWWRIACNRVGKQNGVHFCTDRDPSKGRYVYFDARGNSCSIAQDDVDTQLWERSCWICRLFGSPWLASKVQVLDLPVDREWRPEQLMVRDGVAIDRESETAARGLKYDFEVVPPGTTFDLQLLVENPEDWEMGLLMVGFDLLNEGYALLGGDTSRGLGRVRVDWKEISVLTPRQLLEELSPEAQAEPQPEPGPEEPGARPREEKTGAESAAEAAEEEGEAGEETDPIRATVASLRELGGRADHEALVTAMQQRGWTKQRLQEAFPERKSFNWKQLFERAVKAGQIVLVEGQYALPEVQQAATPADKAHATEQGGAEPEEERRRREAIEKQIRDWKRALKEEIEKKDKEIKEELCSERSTIGRSS